MVPHTGKDDNTKDENTFIIDVIIKIFDWDNAEYLPDISPRAADDLLSDRKRLELPDKLSFIRNVSRYIDHESVVSAIKGLGLDESLLREIQNLIFRDYHIFPLDDEEDEEYEEKPDLSQLNFENKGMRHNLALGYFWTDDENDMEYEILAVTENAVTYYNRSTQKKGTWKRQDAEILAEEMDIWVGIRYYPMRHRPPQARCVSLYRRGGR